MNANQMKNVALAAMAALGSMVTKALGGWDAALRVLVGLMAIDYLTGLMTAGIWHNSNKSDSGALDSRAGFKGLCRKCVVLMLVWIGVLLDEAMGADYVRMAVILFFVGNEGLSLLENIGLMGVKYPPFLKNALEALRDKGEKG